MEPVTAMQERESFPFLRAQLRGTEKIVLDFDCGPGRFSVQLADLIGSCIAVDPMQQMPDLAPSGPGVEYILPGPDGRIPLHDGSADVPVPISASAAAPIQ